MKHVPTSRLQFVIAALVAAGLPAATQAAAPTDKPISYYREVRPIFQANCQGCHQPAKAKGDYVMTDFKKLLAGGENEGAAIAPGHPDKSSVVALVTPENGSAEMPKGKAPLADIEIDLIKRWIAQGALDDTPPDAKRHYDAEHPPLYVQQPVISSIDFSPDGKLIAVAGFHEVLLHNADGSGIAGRLVGLSERVQSLRFSPDGKWLAVAGGDPARLGEVQVWDVQKRKLAMSAPLTYDTLYGVSWSPDSKLIAVGCADNTVRAIEAATGKQTVQMGSHTDLALATTFSGKGDHIISGGRDMTVKLTEVGTQRFIDNVTSITPGALKGGILSIATHPKFEIIAVGGSDGLPKVYRIFRETARKIGDDAQLIADLFPMTGRVFSVAFSSDGKKIASGSSFDGTGEIVISSFDYDSDVPADLRKVMGKVPKQRTPGDQKLLDDYRKKGIHELARTQVPQSAIYSVAFSPDGNTVAAAGSDGHVRLIDANTGAVTKEFPSVQTTGEKLAASKPAWAVVAAGEATAPAIPESLPERAKVIGLEIEPLSIKLGSRNEYAQLLVTARLESGDTADVTRIGHFTVNGSIGEVSPRGVLRPLANGSGRVSFSFAGHTADAALSVSGFEQPYHDDFVQDVNPVLARLGCSAGTCHGAKDGKAGFKLSLRGYDPEYDVRSLSDDLASRRVNVASPDDSLMLLKAVAEVPHEGGRRTTVDDKYYQIIRQWISGGAKLEMKSPRVAKIDVYPRDPVVQELGAKQQMRVVATYTNGMKRDVTNEAFIESGNTDVAAADTTGLVTTLRRGEAPVLARYEGSYAATTVTVMGDRAGFTWQEPPSWGRIDELVAAKWKRMKIEPSGLCTDEEFIRRIHLDLTGLPPSPQDVRSFVADNRDTRVKRDEMIDKLVGNPDFVDHWTNKWADLLQCNSKFLGREGAELYRQWIRAQVEKNMPYNQFVEKILTATGSNRENPAASYWKILRTPQEAMENTTHLFLATRFNCNKCHDHPFERWTQDQYYHTAAYFTQVSLQNDPASAGRKIAGSAVEQATPLFEVVKDAAQGDITHDRTGKVTPPEFPYPAKFEAPEKAPRRELLAEWMTSPDNRYFASSYVNRLWGYLTGVGIIEPLDDIRAGNPATNPPLLDHLTKEFVGSGFNTQHVMKQICKSRAYQLSIATNKWNEDDKINYSHAIARRLPAETLFDAVFKVTGSVPNIPGAKPGMRAQQLPDAGLDTASGLLANLGRPARESSCECERSNEIRLGSVMALLSGPTVAAAIGDPKNALATLVANEPDDRKLVNEVFLRVLNRTASDEEIDRTLETLGMIDSDHKKMGAELAALEKKFASIIAEQTRQRDTAIERTKAGLTAYEEVTKYYREEREKRRTDQIAAETKLMADYEKRLPDKVGEWIEKRDREKRRTEELAASINALAGGDKLPDAVGDWLAKSTATAAETNWVALDPKEVRAEAGVKLEKQKDGTILSSGQDAEADYIITAETALTGITGVMLEVLPDETLPFFGPGRANGGNFVLSEIELRWTDKAKTLPETMAKFDGAWADFSQKTFDVQQAIDGKNDRGPNGWGIGGAPALQPHRATFKLAKPLGVAGGTELQFTLAHKFRKTFLIGKFRLWVTTAKDPLSPGLPAAVAGIAKIPAKDWKPAQKTAVLDYFRTDDPEFWKRKQALYTSKQPLPIDPKYSGLKTAFAKASEPIRLDPYLVQLRQDVGASTTQVGNKRLTATQDLAWALINNAAFLFNR